MLAATCLAAAALAAPAPFDDAGYLSVADRLQPAFEPLWDERAGHYRVQGSGVETTTNANLLLVHAVAAMEGSRGPTRQDRRARRIAAQLLGSPPYAATPPPRLDVNSQWHAPGWVSSMRRLRSGQHVMVDAEVVDGLVHAWMARRELGLPPRLSRRIGESIHAVATDSFWRWPAIRLNQFSWYARIYSADAIVTGRSRLLRYDLARQIARFAQGATGTLDRAGNLGPGLRFSYFPGRRMQMRENFDSPEYANIVASFTRYYDDARRRGMRRAPRIYRPWLRRVLAGYWTHGGYLSWDTGLGFRRWHQAKKLGLAQQALIGIAAARRLAGPRTRAWAKWVLDRGLDFYLRHAAMAGGLAPGLFFGVNVKPQSLGSARLAAARISGNAARAVAAGLGSAPATEPPPLYAFDPDTGRLAVSTPTYNTAIVPVSQRAFPYGGIELARLFDGRQEVAANIGGQPPTAFGLVVHDRNGRRSLATQRPRIELGGRPLRLTRAPAGVGAPIRSWRAYAGSFSDLRATGTARSGRIFARTRHRFTPRAIETRWTLRGATGHSARVLFPSWGPGANVIAVRSDGSRLVVGGRRLPLRGVRSFCVRSARSGYTIVPLRLPAGATARVLLPRRQSSNPRPGPTLAVEVLRRGDAGRVSMSVRLETGRECAR